MNIHIRFAEVEDMGKVVPLMAQLGYPITQEALESRFKSFMAYEGYGIVVACQGREIVACIAWSESMLFISDAIRIHIEALVVDNHCRGKGIGQQLIAFVESIAQQRLPAIVDLTSSAKRAEDGTHDFYRKLGYRNAGELEKIYLRKQFTLPV